MMDFITIPLVVGMITLGIYKLFELFVRKKERLMIIEKAGEKQDLNLLQNQLSRPVKVFNRFSSGSLKAGCLLLGVGVGLMVGFLITNFVPLDNMNKGTDWQMRETIGVVYGAAVLLFGGISLLLAFAIEMKYSRKLEA
ncbi:DUF6249 domain-containing protein [Roseimarinus sediminis]|uniref:DUF6249 domain-containing protein n=1 Tax=Roseimarinus sediminis TaxID=1610899 RepID=UPI003D2459AD